MKHETLKIFLFLFLVSFPVSAAEKSKKLTEYDSCNWLVDYRGHTYDLAPLTRESLARPIESDLRQVLQRVPEANEHLKSMSKDLRDARGHTILATSFVTAFILARVLGANQKNMEKRDEFDLISLVAATFFVKATYESWHSSQTAKSELMQAVNEFNEQSPHKIEPAHGPGMELRKD